MRDKVFTWLQTLSEEDLQPLVADLLRAMGYERVSVTHGPLEFGRDLVFHDTDRLGRKTWRGVQAKVTAFTGNMTSSSGLRAVLQQCEAALDTEFITSTAEKVMLKEIWIVTTKPITEAAKQSAFGKLRNLSSIYLIDGSHLSDLIAQYLPELERSKSHAIESYIEKLIEYCDSVEQYVSFRFNTKFSLSDVYIPSRLTVQLASAESIDDFFPLPIVGQLASLHDSIEESIALSRAKLLPTVSHFQTAELMTRLRDIVQIILKVPWQKRDSESVSRQLSSLASILDIQAFTSMGSGMSPNDYRFKCSITSDVLLEIEADLTQLDYDEVKILEKYREAISVTYVPDSREFFANRERLRVGREEFFSNLFKAYKSSVNPLDSLTKIAREAAHLIYTRNRRFGLASLDANGGVPTPNPADVEQAKEAITTLEKVIDEFQHDVVHRVRSLWSSLELAIQEKNSEALLSEDNIGTLTELEQLTRFLWTYNLMPEEACVRVGFDAFELCLKTPKLAVLGNLGHGKTTLFKQLAKKIASSVDPEGRAGHTLPAICTLATLSDSSKQLSMEDFIGASQAGIGNLGELAAGTVALFLDGFDEVSSPSLSEKILEWFNDGQRSSCKVLLSSRLDAIPTYLPAGMTAKLLPFSDAEIEQFIRGFPWQQASGPDLLIDLLRNEPELFELATTPLLLTIIVILAQRWGLDKVPRRKEGLYKLILDLLFREWDAYKGFRREQEIDDEVVRERILKKVAYKLYSERKRSFSREEFIDAIVSVQQVQPIPVDSAVRVFAKLVRDCIVLPLSKDNYGFFHFSIQEFLAAEDLCDDVNPNRVFDAIQQFCLHSGWWEEVLVFYAGLKRDITGILEELHKKSFPAFTELYTPTYMEVESLNPDFVRLVKRMVQAADLTDIGALNIRGPVAWVFVKLGIAGEKAKWEQMAKARY